MGVGVGGSVTGEVETSYRVLVDVKTVGFTPTGETLKIFEQKKGMMSSLGPLGLSENMRKQNQGDQWW